jgi:hypothetical protein
MRDLMNKIQIVRAIAPAAAATDNTPFVSQIIDTLGYNSLCFAIALGSLADADATFTTLLEDGDDPALADHATVSNVELTGTDALASFDFSADNALRKIGYIGHHRYVRLTITPANNTGSAFVSAVAILGYPNSAPTPNPPV